MRTKRHGGPDIGQDNVFAVLCFRQEGFHWAVLRHATMYQMRERGRDDHGGLRTERRNRLLGLLPAVRAAPHSPHRARNECRERDIVQRGIGDNKNTIRLVQSGLGGFEGAVHR